MKKIKLFLLGCSVVMISFTLSAQNSLHFDGVNDYVQTTSDGVSGNNARTIEAWIKTTANALPVSSGGTGQKVIVDFGTFVTGQRFTMNLLWSNSIRLEVGGSGVSGTLAVNDGVWHHVAVVHDPTVTNNILLYIDGVLNTSGSLTVNTTTTNDIVIGQRIDGVNKFLGEIDDVRIWSVAKTQQEIAADMGVEICGAPSGLEAYYKLNEGVAGGTNTGITTAADEIAGANGTLNGFGLTGATSNWVAGQTLGVGVVVNDQTLNECAGFSITIGSNTYTSTGVYADTLIGASIGGCDSIVNTDLTVAPTITNNQTLNECAGFSITIGSNTYTSTGIYADTLVGASATGCDSIVNTDLTVTPLDIAITNTSPTLTANQAGATYQWLDCGNSFIPVSGATSQSFSPTVNGFYCVEITINNCVDTSICESVVNVGINELNQKIVSIYPNPTTNAILVNLGSQLDVVNYTLTSITGQVIKENTVNNTNTISIDISTQAKGVYFLKLNNFTYKVIKK